MKRQGGVGVPATLGGGCEVWKSDVCFRSVARRSNPEPKKVIFLEGCGKWKFHGDGKRGFKANHMRPHRHKMGSC